MFSYTLNSNINLRFLYKVTYDGIMIYIKLYDHLALIFAIPIPSKTFSCQVIFQGLWALASRLANKLINDCVHMLLNLARTIIHISSLFFSKN